MYVRTFLMGRIYKKNNNTMFFFNNFSKQTNFILYCIKTNKFFVSVYLFLHEIFNIFYRIFSFIRPLAILFVLVENNRRNFQLKTLTVSCLFWYFVILLQSTAIFFFIFHKSDTYYFENVRSTFDNMARAYTYIVMMV